MTWDYDKIEYDKQANADLIWQMERAVNYGSEEKIDRDLLKKCLPEMKIPDDKRAFLELLLWNKPF